MLTSSRAVAWPVRISRTRRMSRRTILRRGSTVRGQAKRPNPPFSATPEGEPLRLMSAACLTLAAVLAMIDCARFHRRYARRRQRPRRQRFRQRVARHERALTFRAEHQCTALHHRSTRNAAFRLRGQHLAHLQTHPECFQVDEYGREAAQDRVSRRGAGRLVFRRCGSRIQSGAIAEIGRNKDRLNAGQQRRSLDPTRPIWNDGRTVLEIEPHMTRHAECSAISAAC